MKSQWEFHCGRRRDRLTEDHQLIQDIIGLDDPALRGEKSALVALSSTRRPRQAAEHGAILDCDA